jgi:hypothetical protein
MIVTARQGKHRTFSFVPSNSIAESTTVAVCVSDAFFLGVLSSKIHECFSLRSGGRLGVGNDPRYFHTRCFNPFPFPAATEAQRAEIARIAEALDRHRKEAQSRHPEITLTQMYNVLEKLRDGEALSADDKLIHDNALILILKELHDELDAAVVAAYGWPVDLAEDEVLARLVALNKERAAEEAKGFVRWLRPEYQIPRFGSDAEKKQLEAFEDVEQTPAAAKAIKPNFPTDAVEQVAAVMAALAQREANASAAELARGFKQGKKCEARVAATLASLARTGFIATAGEAYALRRAA